MVPACLVQKSQTNINVWNNEINKKSKEKHKSRCEVRKEEIS